MHAQIYVIGGQDASGTILDTVTAYDAILEEDTNLTAMPLPRSNFAIATSNASIYVIGGYATPADVGSFNPQGCILGYTIASDSWSRGACMATPRADACAAELDGTIYVAGAHTHFLQSPI